MAPWSQSLNKAETTRRRCFSKVGCETYTCADGCSFACEGTPCSEFSPGFSFLGSCRACPNENTKGTAQFAVLACEGAGMLIAVLGPLWYLVPPWNAADTEETRGPRGVLEERLLPLSYCQVLDLTLVQFKNVKTGRGLGKKSSNFHLVPSWMCSLCGASSGTRLADTWKCLQWSLPR